MSKKNFIKIKKKIKLFDLKKDTIYQIYINMPYKTLVKNYSFIDKELRNFLKEHNLETKRELIKRKLTDNMNKNNFAKLIKIFDAETLAKRYNCSKRTIFNYKKRFGLKGQEFKRKEYNERKITKNEKSSIINALLFSSIQDVATRYNCSILRIEEYLSQYREEEIPKLDLEDFKQYIKINNNVEDILKRYKISKINLMLILIKLKLKLKLKP